VLRVSYGDSSVLLEGDAQKQVERRIAALHEPQANLLKVGHHGSANATTPELVASAKPDFAIISVGSGNSFGLPRNDFLDRMAAAGTRVYRTDLNGAVTFLPRRPLRHAFGGGSSIISISAVASFSSTG
jgi:competence protein ComEC